MTGFAGKAERHHLIKYILFEYPYDATIKDLQKGENKVSARENYFDIPRSPRLL